MAVPLRGREGGKGLAIKKRNKIIHFFSFKKKIWLPLSTRGGGQGINGSAIKKITFFIIFVASLVSSKLWRRKKTIAFAEV